jgi:molybdopterin molybdotransferase
VLEVTGEIDFWKIAMKPGRPLTYGRIGDARFFGLPGNPVAVMVTFYQFVRPALQYMISGAYQPPLQLTATSTSAIRKRPGRFEFQRGIYQQDESGNLSVGKTGKQGSGVLMSMSKANCFILLPEECDGVGEGEPVTIQPFETFV